MEDPPMYKLTPEEVQEFRTLLAHEVGHKLEHSDAEIEQMARDAIVLVWTLRDIHRRRARRRTGSENSLQN